jgi:hypothetical protein
MLISEFSIDEAVLRGKCFLSIICHIGTSACEAPIKFISNVHQSTNELGGKDTTAFGCWLQLFDLIKEKLLKFV